MRGKKRPTADKARAVGIAVMDGASEASRLTGIPRPTIVGWTQEPQFDELRQRKTEAVGEEWWAGIQLAFRRSIELLASTDDPVKAATAGAIIFDKLALSRGEATVRTESTLLQGRSDHEQQLLAGLINGELERRADSHAPSDQAADPVAQPEAREASPA